MEIQDTRTHTHDDDDDDDDDDDVISMNHANMMSINMKDKIETKKSTSKKWQEKVGKIQVI